MVIALAACAGGVYLAVHHIFSSPLRRALPAGATEVRGKYVDMFPDFTHFLKARMPRDQFREYVEALGLAAYSADADPGEADWLHWIDGAPYSQEWWPPGSELAGTHYSVEGDVITMARYEDGVVYVQQYSH